LRFLLYGANGYTGRLIAQEAVRRGLHPILAGRTASSIEPLARELNLRSRSFPLSADNIPAIAAELADVDLVLNCAGPFALTARPMIEACLQAKVHYLDITGEIDVIEFAAAQSSRAVAAGITVLPAVGFDVVPTDCLALMLLADMLSAVSLKLAFAALGQISRGTAKTLLRKLPEGGMVRKQGKLIKVPTAWKSQKIRFHDHARWAMTIPWGDVASAFYSTGIPDIEVYAAAPRKQIKAATWIRWMLPALGVTPFRQVAEWWIDRKMTGPTEAERSSGRSMIWGQVTDGQGRTIERCLETLDGYALTIETALAAIRRFSESPPATGYQTPCTAFGADFIAGIPGTEVFEASVVSGK